MAYRISRIQTPNYGDSLEPLLRDIIEKLNVLIDDRNMVQNSVIVIPDSKVEFHKTKFEVLEKIDV